MKNLYIQFRILTLGVILGGVVASARAEIPAVLINSTFEAEGQNATIKEVEGGDLPLAHPTVVRLPNDGDGSVTAITEPEGGIQPPAAILRTKNDADGKQASVSLTWDLRRESLQTGRYELSYTVSSLIGGATGGRMIINVEPTNKASQSSDSLHPNQFPLQCYFGGRGMLWATQNGPKFMPGQAFAISIKFDLDERVWSVTIDDAILFENKPFPPNFADTSNPLTVTGVTFSGGAIGSGAETAFVLGPVKMVALP